VKEAEHEIRIPKSEFRNPKPEEVEITIEAFAWVTRFVGGDGTRRRLFREAAPVGATVGQVLRQLSGRFPQLHEALWARSGAGLSEHIEVFVNDAVLGQTHELDSPLRDGDRITLVGQYTGGATAG
jgi:molybdopterin converting factor small subunit